MIRRIWRWLNAKFQIVSDDPYYGWADEWLDERGR